MALGIREAQAMVEEFLEEAQDIETYEQDEEGQYHFDFGSTRMSIQVYQHKDLDLPLINFRAGVACDFERDDISREAALGLLALNWEAPLGNISLPEEDSVIWFEYNLPLELVNKEWLAGFISLVSSVADEIDDDVAELVGGERATD